MKQMGFGQTLSKWPCTEDSAQEFVMRIIEKDVCKCFSKQTKKILFKSIAYTVSKQKGGPVMEAEGGGGKRDTDSFCEHVGLFLKLLTLTNKVAVN